MYALLHSLIALIRNCGAALASAANGAGAATGCWVTDGTGVGISGVGAGVGMASCVATTAVWTRASISFACCVACAALVAVAPGSMATAAVGRTVGTRVGARVGATVGGRGTLSVGGATRRGV